MKELHSKYSILEMAAYLKVSSSGYYEWLKNNGGKKEEEDRTLKELIKEEFTLSKQTYGVDRVIKALGKKGVHIGRHRTRRLMREEGLVPKARRKFKVTTDSDHDDPVAANLLDQNFDVDAPNKVWVGDITYVPTNEGWLYVAVVIDLFSRKVVGWAMSSRMKRSLVIDAFKMAVKRRKPRPGLIFHSDRGKQYCSKDFRKLIESVKALQSMSGKGNCYDNAVAESFFHTLKVEQLHWYRFLTRNSAKRAVFEFIEMFYNTKRLHSYLHFKSPEQFEKIYYYGRFEKCA